MLGRALIGPAADGDSGQLELVQADAKPVEGDLVMARQPQPGPQK
jgi:hypothetical protein